MWSCGWVFVSGLKVLAMLGDMGGEVRDEGGGVGFRHDLH